MRAGGSPGLWWLTGSRLRFLSGEHCDEAGYREAGGDGETGVCAIADLLRDGVAEDTQGGQSADDGGDGEEGGVHGVYLYTAVSLVVARASLARAVMTRAVGAATKMEMMATNAGLMASLGLVLGTVAIAGSFLWRSDCRFGNSRGGGCRLRRDGRQRAGFWSDPGLGYSRPVAPEGLLQVLCALLPGLDELFGVFSQLHDIDGMAGAGQRLVEIAASGMAVGKCGVRFGA